MIDIKVPAVGESISEVTLVKWLKQEGQYVQRDEVIAELESEKATFEVNAEKAGVLKTVGKEGDTLKIGDVVARIDETAVKSPCALCHSRRNPQPPHSPQPPSRARHRRTAAAATCRAAQPASANGSVTATPQ